MTTMQCKVCSSSSIPFAQATVLGKHTVQYYRCVSCGFVQTEDPYWLDEAYSSAIADSDIGLVSRNIMLSRVVKSLIIAFFTKDGKFLDYGAGYGLFVRLMRDSGFDFYWSDKHCENLFAKQFDARMSGETRYELVTAFEVFEHLVNPLEETEQMLKHSGSIFFSTLLMPPNSPKPEEWWYYALDHGQHVALYTEKSLAVIAEKFHLNLYSNGSSLHLLTQRTISPRLFKLVCRARVASMINSAVRRKSLVPKDYFRLTGKKLT